MTFSYALDPGRRMIMQINIDGRWMDVDGWTSRASRRHSRNGEAISNYWALVPADQGEERG